MNFNLEIIFGIILVIAFIKNVSFLDFYFKFILCYIWVLGISFLAIPLLALRPNNVLNSVPLASVMKHASKLSDLKCEIRDGENLSVNQSCIIVANHQSSLDLIGMFEIVPFAKRMTAIAKRELMYVGTFGISCWLVGIKFIDRKAGGKAGQAMNEAMLSLKAEKTKLWIFPEGTRRNTGEIHQFKKGAFHAAIHAQVPIVPVVYSSYKHFLNTKEREFKKGNVIITVLPEISTVGLTANDVDDLITRTRKVMIEKYNETSIEAEISWKRLYEE